MNVWSLIKNAKGNKQSCTATSTETAAFLGLGGLRQDVNLRKAEDSSWFNL